MEMAKVQEIDVTGGRPMAAAVPPGDFLALIQDMGAMLDKKMEAQSVNIDGIMDEMMEAHSAGLDEMMEAHSAGLRSGMQENLAALESQLGESMKGELVPLKEMLLELSDVQEKLWQDIEDAKSGQTRTTPASSEVPVSMLESTGEIDRILNELDPANPAARDPGLVEKVLMRSREVKLRNFRCTYGMPEEPQLFLGDGNVLALRRAGKTFTSVEDVLDAVDFFTQVLIVAGKVPVATATAYRSNVRAHRLSISCPDLLAEAHDRFRLRLIQKSSWEFAEGFPPALAKEFEVLCHSQMRPRVRFYSDPGTMGRSGPFRGKCFDCDRQGHKRGDIDCPMNSQKLDWTGRSGPFWEKCFDCDGQGHKRGDNDCPSRNFQKMDAGQVKAPFSGPPSAGGGNQSP